MLHTERLRHPIAYLGTAVIVAAVIVIAVVALNMRSGLVVGGDPQDRAADDDPTPVTDGDLADLDTSFVTVIRMDDTTGTISRDEGWAKVEADYGPEFANATAIDAYLGLVTDKTSRRIDGRPIWLYVAYGLKHLGSAPFLPDGNAGEPTTYTKAYIYVDAFTGEVIESAFTR